MHSIIPGAGDKQPAICREGHIVWPNAHGNIANPMERLQLNDSHVPTAPITDVKILSVRAKRAGVRVLADGNGFIKLERSGFERPDLMIRLVANIQDSGGGMDGDSGEEDWKRLRSGMNRSLQSRVAVRVPEYIDHAAISAAHVKMF